MAGTLIPVLIRLHDSWQVPGVGGFAMASGKVKWFNNAKGYGFILPEQGGDDLFAHYSTIVMDGYKTLRAGQDVEFDIESGPKGMHAVNIRASADEAQGFADLESATAHYVPVPS
jgi:CspA family cold shock protein